MGNIRGSVIAAVILTLLPELLRGVVSDYRMLIYAIVLIVMMLFNWAPTCIEWRKKVVATVKSKFVGKASAKEAE
jgi:branched-chain amino acid transport system permease protein